VSSRTRHLFARQHRVGPAHEACGKPVLGREKEAVRKLALIRPRHPARPFRHQSHRGTYSHPAIELRRCPDRFLIGLVTVFVYQVPYTNRLEPIRSIGARLIELSRQLQTSSAGALRAELSPAALHLVINLVTSTIMQLVIDPPDDVAPRVLPDELTLRLAGWLREDTAST
jgi:hypothetical protein